MFSRRIRAAVLVVTASVGLSACAAYDGYGYGGGYYGSGYGMADAPYYGWYNDYYYPGTGYYVYDRDGRHHAWDRDQRRYWQSRARYRGNRGANWQNYRANRGDRPQVTPARPVTREDWRSSRPGREQYRSDRRGDQRQSRRRGRGDRD